MADQSDVEDVLVGLIGGVLYPAGADAVSLLGPVCRVYRGWPTAAALEDDLAAGVVNVTVFPEAAVQSVTTRWPDEWAVVAAVTPTLTAAISGTTVSFAGAAGPGQVAGILADNVAAVHRTEAGDTPERVAAVLASYLATQRIALAAGATVLVPGAARLEARVMADQPALRETRRQRQGFRISCWCADPLTRDRAAGAVDAALSGMDFIALPDGTQGRLRFHAGQVFDHAQNAQLYRRDLVYSVDYATTQAAVLPSMIFGAGAVSPEGATVLTKIS